MNFLDNVEDFDNLADAVCQIELAFYKSFGIMIKIFLFITVLILVSPSHSKAHSNDNGIDCGSTMVMSEMIVCGFKPYHIENKKLLLLIEHLKKTLDKTNLKNFNLSQEKWEKWNESDAKFSAYYHAGNGREARLHDAASKTENTKDRIKNLVCRLESYYYNKVDGEQKTEWKKALSEFYISYVDRPGVTREEILEGDHACY